VHYNEAQWADLVRGLVNEDLATEMLMHLASGCRRCNVLHSSLAAVEEAFLEDRLRPVPDDLAARARAVFPTRRRSWRDLPRELADFVADTMQQPALAGVRSAPDAPRHFSFHTEAYQVDLQMERQMQPAAHLLTGQLTPHTAEAAIAGLSVVVLDGQTEVQRQVTNEFGEFYLDFPALRQPTLLLLVDGETRTIELPLWSTLEAGTT
jgi:hypothetical protein